MSKRELGALAMDVDVGGPRAKRRKDTVTPTTGVNEASGVSSRVTGMNGEDVDMVEASGSNGQESASVKELGLQVWHTVREAVNKNNIIPSPPFMRLPPKRVYPDYYTIISQPVCLDDIKKRLDTAKYHTFDELKADFDLCFDNAKEYNLKGSELWEDAKFLQVTLPYCSSSTGNSLLYVQKTVHKELGKITGKKDKKQKKEGHGEEQDGDEDDGQKKNKPSTMKRLLKARLQKLIEKTNDEYAVTIINHIDDAHTSTVGVAFCPTRSWSSHPRSSIRLIIR
ncbi:Bromodomain-domain-containing protein [Coniophora puteana RWD-64-598 SS2]|uniref:Bromodomain-domain-containing protein n=1 Tax=Coniophora puteana (strain RWD-64-598) TaxID=741705 RepID=A0A5M3N758_CONPW|nr:Bromodomain-containing protein [Coniophora puteana RWD-64-598 SS2]EIW86997.1 Bromodomain-domain-containing protein [Coniophora puteana RWD-64-598 SS2]